MIINTRTDLAKHFNDLGFKTGVEVGASEGDFALTLCQEIPDLKYCGIDSWNRAGFQAIRKKLSEYKPTLITNSSQAALKKFRDSSLDFVYINGDHHFDAVVMDILGWVKKVKKGGIVAGGAYNGGRKNGVIPAVDGYVSSHSLYLNLTADKAEGTTWWFIKKWNV